MVWFEKRRTGSAGLVGRCNLAHSGTGTDGRCVRACGVWFFLLDAFVRLLDVRFLRVLCASRASVRRLRRPAPAPAYTVLTLLEPPPFRRSHWFIPAFPIYFAGACVHVRPTPVAAGYSTEPLTLLCLPGAGYVFPTAGCSVTIRSVPCTNFCSAIPMQFGSYRQRTMHMPFWFRHRYTRAVVFVLSSLVALVGSCPPHTRRATRCRERFRAVPLRTLPRGGCAPSALPYEPRCHCHFLFRTRRTPGGIPACRTAGLFCAYLDIVQT